MGDCFQKLGDLDAAADEAASLADSVLAWLVAEDIVCSQLTDCVLGGLGHRPGVRHARALQHPADAVGTWTGLPTNGLQIDVGRQVYYGGQGGVSDAVCPKCRAVQPFHQFSDALTDWYTRAVGDHLCPACNQPSSINDWRLDPQWGVGHLLLTFWNWPPLSEQFKRDVAARLNHHRLLYIYDKL